MIPISQFYDCLLRNKLPMKKYFVEDEGDLVSQMSRIFNKEIYTVFRNSMCYSEYKRPVALGRIKDQCEELEKSKQKKKKKQDLHEEVSKPKPNLPKGMIIYASEKHPCIYLNNVVERIKRDYPHFIIP